MAFSGGSSPFSSFPHQPWMIMDIVVGLRSIDTLLNFGIIQNMLEAKEDMAGEFLLQQNSTIYTDMMC